jgi:hypothetical protein
VVVNDQNLPHSAEHKIHSTEHATGGEFPLFLTALTPTSTMTYIIFLEKLTDWMLGFSVVTQCILVGGNQSVGGTCYCGLLHK